MKKNKEKASESIASDDEIEPMTGKPYFSVLLSKTYVESTSQLAIPAEGARLFPDKIVPVILTRGTKNWEMNYCGKHATAKRLDGGWKQFAVDNKLKIGDVCVFEQMTAIDAVPVKLKVQVLRGDFPSVMLDKVVGTSDKPLIIE